MTATLEQRGQLDVLDALAVLSEVDALLRDTTTRLANRARTNDEADDVRLLIRCRARLSTLRAAVAGLHKDCRGDR